MKNINDINAYINTNSLPFTIAKNNSKKYVLTHKDKSENVFNTIAQTSAFLIAENKRINPKGVILPSDKQGASNVKIDTASLVAGVFQFKCPVPTKVKDKIRSTKVSKEESAPVDCYVDLIRDEDGKVPSEISEITALKNKFNSIVDKYCLNVQVNGFHLVSVHHRNIINDSANEIKDKLSKAKNAIVAKLPEWKQIAIDSNRIINVVSKFPDVEYFDKFKIKAGFCLIDDSFDFIDEAKDSAIEKLKDTVQNFVSSLNDYLSGDAKSFHNSNMEKVVETASILKDGGFIKSDAFDKFVVKAIALTDDFNIEAIRTAKKTIDKGIVTPKTSGKGRRAIPISQDDIKDSKEYINKSVESVADLAKELEGLI